MKKSILIRSLLLLVCLMLSCTAVFAEEETQVKNSFSWNGYQLYFAGATTDMESYGIADYQGAIAVVRMAPVEGTIKESDFKQQRFVLVDPEGNEHSCRFFTCPNNEKNAMGFPVLDAEQAYIDMLFELGTLTEETIHLCSVAVSEDEEAEPVLIPLAEATETITVPKGD